MKHYLLDASAIMLLIKKADIQTTLKYLQNSSILDLTYYEIGNAIYKENVLTKQLTPEATKILQKTAQSILMAADRLSIEVNGFEKILEIAKIEKLTFYDSSYIHFAIEKGLQLITEDKELKEKAKKYIPVKIVTELLSN